MIGQNRKPISDINHIHPPWDQSPRGSSSMYEDRIKRIRKDIEKVAGYLWEKGWAERNGGNISARIDIPEVIPEVVRSHDVERLPEGSQGMDLLITGTDKRMRDIAEGEGLGLIRVREDLSGYDVLWSKDPEFKATSELISHVKIHLDQEEKNKAVVHSHPTELIALSHHPDYGKVDSNLSGSLWSMMPEIKIFLPKGISLIPYTMTGSEKLADMTVEAFKDSDVVIWSKHGAVAVGSDPEDAFDKLDLANKGADILLRCLSAGFDPEGIPERDLEELEDI